MCIRDSLFGVVSTHLCTVVDILLEDVAKHIGVDVLATGSNASVEVPTPSVEEVEKADKGVVVNLDVGILVFQDMSVEHTAIEVRNFAIFFFKFRIMNRCVQSVVKELNEKTLVERIKEAVFTLFFSYPFKFMAQIVEIKVQEAFFLNEIAEHKAIEHNGSVPMLVFVFLVGYVIIDARNKLDKSRVFFLEPCIKIFSDFFGVHSESTLHLRAEVNDSCMYYPDFG